MLKNHLEYVQIAIYPHPLYVESPIHSLSPTAQKTLTSFRLWVNDPPKGLIVLLKVYFLTADPCSRHETDT